MRTRDDRIKTYEAMKKYGGGFLAALAEAYIRADDDNTAKIEKEWENEIVHVRNLYSLFGQFEKNEGQEVGV